MHDDRRNFRWLSLVKRLKPLHLPRTTARVKNLDPKKMISINYIKNSYYDSWEYLKSRIQIKWIQISINIYKLSENFYNPSIIMILRSLAVKSGFDQRQNSPQSFGKFDSRSREFQILSRQPAIIVCEFFISLAIDSLTFSSGPARWNSASMPTFQRFSCNENARVGYTDTCMRSFARR